MRNISVPIVFTTACALLAFPGCGAAANPSLPAPAAPVTNRASATPTGVVIPMYVYPGPAWNEVIVQKEAHPKVPVLLIADVTNTGVGNKKYSAYATYIAKERAAGVRVIGYVATGYGKTSMSVVETQMSRWYAYYGVDGIFLDEADSRDKVFFSTVTAYAHAHSLPYVMANPGTNAPADLGTDAINYYENRGYPSHAFLEQPAHVDAGKSRWSYIAGAVPFDVLTIVSSSRYVSYLYATDGKEPECYCKLPSYFAQLMTVLAHLDGG